MAMPPQAQTNAPSGPRKPHMRTEPAPAAADWPHELARPEGIAADALVPGDVPDASDGRGGDGDYAGRDVPGDGGRAFGGAFRPSDCSALSHSLSLPHGRVLRAWTGQEACPT